MRLQDKVILITGSTTGIGEAMARRFIAEGARVVLHGRDAVRGEALRQELGLERTALCLGDLSDPAFAEVLVAAARQAFGRLDVLVNNAAITTRGKLLDTDPAFFDRIMAVNVRAPLLLIRAAIDDLRKSEGVVLNIGSILAYSGQTNLLAYCISKGGLMTMTRNLADALGPFHVRVNQLNVGWTLTENEYQVKLGDGLGERWHEEVPVSAAPSGRLLMPEDIAAAAVYWVGDESRPVSGTVAELEQYPIIGRIAGQEKVSPEAILGRRPEDARQAV